MPTDTNLDRAIYDLLFHQCPAMWLGFPIGAGNVYWVDGINGLATNSGLRPDQPLLTIDSALALCVDDHNDYIMVLDCWQQEGAGNWPITVDVTRVHIIGLPGSANGYNGGYPAMQPPDDNPVFLIDAAGIYSEIAGFNLSGGATSGCIHLGQAIGVWIHDCIFGSDLAGGTPQDGIRFTAGNAEILRVENCQFIGDNNNAKGVIARNAIEQPAGGGSRCLNAIIRNNHFLGCLISINLGFAEGMEILDNVFGVLDLANGEAITLQVASEGCLVNGNHAMNGNAQVGYAQNPYRDLGAPDNHWGVNYRGNLVIEPVIV